MEFGTFNFVYNWKVDIFTIGLILIEMRIVLDEVHKLEERLHVNTVNELELLIRERIQLRLSVMKSCPRFELFIGTESDEFTRLTFHLNRKGLRKLDVDSPDELPPLSTSL
ncbi:hypothetical protein PRIPAC_96612 [Pristionchus pacificus]|uniref:Uncharacterized protein n=1 Tax=Pristionchus pacificus TaxID=54126 RepID=A0A2A6B2V4_PRIPA|nr:hypothetical protein PRIPAC_96612 [Pristionchus pacificus]|eukprot:PDM60209.1 hypothetical protein PRIPAC_54034 [Pristionchus pacificus]